MAPTTAVPPHIAAAATSLRDILNVWGSTACVSIILGHQYRSPEGSTLGQVTALRAAITTKTQLLASDARAQLFISI